MAISDSQNQMLDDLLFRIGETCDQIGYAWPYRADQDTGVWGNVDDGDWCGGFWVECLRIKGRLESKPELIEEALERTKARHITDRLSLMLDSLQGHIAPRGRLLDGCFNRPKNFADLAELIWGTAYLTMALSYLEEERVPC